MAAKKSAAKKSAAKKSAAKKSAPKKSAAKKAAPAKKSAAKKSGAKKAAPAKQAAPAGTPRKSSRARKAPAKRSGTGRGTPPPGADDVLESPAPPPEADAVFVGTVLQTASSSVAEVEPAADTVVVRVDQVVSGAPAFQDHLGEPITVALPEGVAVAPGDVHVFHVTAWIFGSGLAVRAISVGEQPLLERAITAEGRPGTEERLRSRIASADRVVSGVVRQVRHVPVAEDHPITEHDPLWNDATVAVHDQLGQAAGATPDSVTVRFASSRDVRWHDAPKFVVGDRGVWLLGAPQPVPRSLVATEEELPDNHYIVIDPDDFQPASDAPTLLAALDEGLDEERDEP